jgi:hypothetical protein
MHYKTHSLITIGILVGLMIVVAVAINNIEGSITGAVVKPACDCNEDSDCDDSNECTEDVCLYPESCDAALCVNKNIENCE